MDSLTQNSSFILLFIATFLAIIQTTIVFFYSQVQNNWIIKDGKDHDFTSYFQLINFNFDKDENFYYK